MICFSEVIDENVRSVGVVGHVHPDGDCAGSVMAVTHYLHDNYPEISVTTYLEPVIEGLMFLIEGTPIREDDGEGEEYDLMISVDVSDMQRLGAGKAAFEKALSVGKTVCIDHHMTNPGFANVNHIEAQASSTCEVLTGLFDLSKVERDCAICLYTGIIHDTGVFRYDSTSSRTLLLTAELLKKDIPTSEIIQSSFTDHPYSEMKITAEVLMNGELIRNERFFVGYCPLEMTIKNGLTSRNLGGIVADLTNIQECDVILFMYQYEDGMWKGSLRSKCDVNVAAIAERFGGGGHEKAAGFAVNDHPEEAVLKVRSFVKEMRKA